MRWVCLWLVAFSLLYAAPLRAADFSSDGLNLARAYLAAANPMAAVAPLRAIESRERDPAMLSKVRLLLAQAYLEAGLLDECDRVLIRLSPADANTGMLAVKLHLQVAVRHADAPKALRNLEGLIQAGLPVDADTLTAVARLAFSAGLTAETLVLLAKRESGAEKQYFEGAARLAARDVNAAYAAFVSAAAGTEAERAKLALGRIFFSAGDLNMASRYYASVDPLWPGYDDVLYESAWLAMAQADVTAASTALQRLVVEHPFSPRVPRAQVLFGYLLLQQGNFERADASFGSYVGHYASLAERAGQLAAVEDPARMYTQLYGELDRIVAQGSSGWVELVAWLEKSERMSRAESLMRRLQGAEAELTSLDRDVDTLMALALGGFDGDEGIRQASSAARKARSEFEEHVTPLGERVSGRRGEAFAHIDKQLAVLHATGEELQSQWNRLSELRRAPEQALQGVVAARAVRLQSFTERELRILEVWERTHVLEDAMRKLMLNMLAPEIPRKRGRLLDKLAAEVAAKQRDELMAYRNAVTLQAARRPEAVARVEKMEAAAGSHRAAREKLLLQAANLRGEVMRAELEALQSELGKLLVYARRGGIDVAWEARLRLRQRGAALEQRARRSRQLLNDLYAVPEIRSNPAQPGGVAKQLAERTAGADAVAEAISEVLRQARDARTQTRKHVAEFSVGGIESKAVTLRFGDQSPSQSGDAQAMFRLDGRLVNLGREVFVDAGPHQIDGWMKIRNGQGESLTLSSSTFLTFESAQTYRIGINADAPLGVAINVERLP